MKRTSEGTVTSSLKVLLVTIDNESETMRYIIVKVDLGGGLGQNWGLCKVPSVVHYLFPPTKWIDQYPCVKEFQSSPF